MKLMWEKNLDIIYIVLLNYTKKNIIWNYTKIVHYLQQTCSNFQNYKNAITEYYEIIR